MRPLLVYRRWTDRDRTLVLMYKSAENGKYTYVEDWSDYYLKPPAAWEVSGCDS